MSLSIPYIYVSTPPTLYRRIPGWRALHSQNLRPTHACHRLLLSRQSLKVVPAENLSHSIEKEKSFSRKGLITLEAVIYLLQQRCAAVFKSHFGPPEYCILHIAEDWLATVVSIRRKQLCPASAARYPQTCDRGLAVRVRELGPVYRLTCVDAADGEVLAESHGFVAPLFGLMHCDSLRAFTKGWA